MNPSEVHPESEFVGQHILSGYGHCRLVNASGIVRITSECADGLVCCIVEYVADEVYKRIGTHTDSEITCLRQIFAHVLLFLPVLCRHGNGCRAQRSYKKSCK